MALFDGTTEQFQKLVPGLTASFTLENAMPELLLTQEAILPRFLGTAVAEQLAELGDNVAPDDKDLRQALYLAQVAVGRIGFAGYFPFAELQIGDDGITTPATPDRKAAFQYQTNSAKKSLLETGWRALDELIRLVASKPDLFDGWTDSPYYQEHQQAMFKSPAEFSSFYPIQDRWLTFWALRPFIRFVEEEKGEPAQARIDALPGTVSADQKAKLQRKLLRALAYEAILEAAPKLSIELDGVNVKVNYASQYGQTDYYQAPGKDHLSWVMDNLTSTIAVAWSAFETAIAPLENPSATATDTDKGTIYGNGAVVMI